MHGANRSPALTGNHKKGKKMSGGKSISGRYRVEEINLYVFANRAIQNLNSEQCLSRRGHPVGRGSNTVNTGAKKSGDSHFNFCCIFAQRILNAQLTCIDLAQQFLLGKIVLIHDAGLALQNSPGLPAFDTEDHHLA